MKATHVTACIMLMLISAARPLAEGPDWFDRLYRRDASLMKVILKP